MTLDSWLEYQQNLHHKTIDLGLDRVSNVYQILFPKGINFKVITIAGTNGKGSTGCFISSILHYAKISYGWFSSPHIEKYNERFVVNNNFATDNEIIRAFEKIEKSRGKVSLSYFEFSTLAALLIFTKKKIKVAILEVGLGGRLDSVNIVKNNISIITSISFDHIDYLGNTIEKIAQEKAGIIKENTHCILPPGLPPIIANTANKINTKLFIINKYNKPLTMQGEWQQYNAALAKKSVQVLFNIKINIIEEGLKNAFIAGRAEIITYKNKTIIFDVAHNIDAIQKLKTIIPNNTVAIFSALNDKNIAAMIANISSVINKWYVIPIIGDRALSSKEIKHYFKTEKVIECNNGKDALNKILKIKEENILVFGSFLTVAAIKKSL